jgi:CRISPR-associated endonuclease Csn1
LKELGRVLYHLNQKRGYKSSRTEENKDKKETEYVSEIKNRWEKLKEENKTIGQKFYEELLKNPYYRIKQQVFPREAYIDEYNRIMNKQKEFYPDILTDNLIKHIRDEIIYYQRPLKSQKGLVSTCELEGFWIKNKDGKEIFVGPRVAHRSNPLFQVDKIWESINNISIKNKYNEIFEISLDKKLEIFNYLDKNEKITQKELFKILNIKNNSGWYGNKMLSKGIQGNIVKCLIKNAINNKELEEKWLRFELKINTLNKETYLVNKETGEIISSMNKEEVSADFENEPLYKLWHTIYSIQDIDECKKALIKKFGFDEKTAERLAKIDFSKFSYGNKSIKSIRKILPYLMKGYNYSDAASLAGYNHSFTITKEEITNKSLIDKLPILSKNSLRQPVVEKILNQMIHIVNDIIDDKRGWVTREERLNGQFEIRIELARELKQSREERNETFKNLSKIERENKEIEKRLIELGVRPTRKNIIKYRLFTEISEDKINATCIYTGKKFSLSDALNGNNIDVEHIIPRSLLYDDSQSNKTLTFSEVNQEKDNRTAYDYMKSKGEEAFNQYIERVNKLFQEKIISKSKRDKLLTPSNKIPKDMIERNIRETQFITKKAKEILSQVSKNVWTTTGEVTSILRKLWGYNDIIMNLQLNRIKELVPNPIEEGITEIVNIETNDGQIHKKEVIKNWTKRDDHRHHAIDALVIACTKQGFIQRINTLSAETTRNELYEEVSKQSKEFRDKLTLLEKYLILQRPFSTDEVSKKVSQILVSFKPGKKVATYGKQLIRKNKKTICLKKDILVPRGPLSEESVYGKIKIIEKNKPIKYLFENPHLIFKPYIKELVEERLKQCNNDVKKAIESLKENPIFLDKDKTEILKYATCFKEEYVIKYPLTSITEKDIDYIVDEKIKKLIKNRFENNKKDPFKEPLYLDKENKIQIRTVRMLTGLSAVEILKKDEYNNPISFVKPGNNHHIAIYRDESGNYVPHLCTFWHAVERKKYKLPIIIDNPNQVWEEIEKNSNTFYSQSFLDKLPQKNLVFINSIAQNEMFLLNPDNDNRNERYENYSKILYRVQKIFYNGKQLEIFFRHHLETKIDDTDTSRKVRRFYPVKSINALINLNPHKVIINRLGEIILIKNFFDKK